MANETSNAQGQNVGTDGRKRYNLQGTIKGLTVRQDKKDRDWVSFMLERDGKRATKCVAFVAKAEAFLALGKTDGETVRLFGVYNNDTYQKDGETRQSSEFSILWSGEPREPKPAAETSAAAETVDADAAAALA